MERVISKLEPKQALFSKLRRVAAYARVSSGKEAMLQSLAAQVSYYSSYIQYKRDWAYVGVYADEAFTGTKDNRPEFQRLLTDCRARKIDLIMTKSISRFARNTVTLLETVRELKFLGVEVYFEEQNIYSMSGDGELMLTILASYAQEESLSVSENCKWRIRKNYKDGKHNTLRLYGYDTVNSKLVVNPAEAQFVRMIFADYLDGMGKNSIVKKLTRLNAPTKKGGKWSEGLISNMLINEKYIGNMLLQKKYSTDHLTKRLKMNKGELPMYYAEGTHEAIIDISLFELVQDEISYRAKQYKHTKTKDYSDFKSVIRCGICGANFRRKYSSAGTKYAKIVWSCSTYNSRGKEHCSSKQIPENILKELSSQVLGLRNYDSTIFADKIAYINVPKNGSLVFVFKDGTEVECSWENKSRSESWTDEMKETARLLSQRGHQNG